MFTGIMINKKVTIAKEVPEIKKEKVQEINPDDVLNRDFKKMEQFMLINGQTQKDHMQIQLKDCGEILNGSLKNNMTFEEELELRSYLRNANKSKYIPNGFYDGFLPIKKIENNAEVRLLDKIYKNQQERDELNDLHSIIQINYDINDKTCTPKKKYIFPPPSNQSALEKIFQKKEIINYIEYKDESEVVEDENKIQNISSNNLNQNSQMKQNDKIKKYIESHEGFDEIIQNKFGVQSEVDIDEYNNYYDNDDDSDSQDDRSNFDKVSVYSKTSKAKSQVEKDWEYNSQRDYNIREIQKLTDKQEIEVQNIEVPKEVEKNEENNQNNEEKEEDQIIENQEQEENKKDKQKKKQLKVKKKRVINIKQEMPYEEFQTMNIHDKIQHVVQYDYIQKVSFGYNQNSITIHPENQVQYHRDITSQARDLLCVERELRGVFYEQDRNSLLELEDIYIDLNDINFQDITNLVSDRVPETLVNDYSNPTYVAENFNKFSLIPDISNSDTKQFNSRNYINSYYDFNLEFL